MSHLLLEHVDSAGERKYRLRRGLGWYAILCLPVLFQFTGICTAVYGQYFDSTTRISAEEYLQTVMEKIGDGALGDVPRNDALALAATFGQLDRLTVTPEVFLEHLEFANKVRDRFYADIPDESFQQYILAVRIRSELTSHAGWRKRLATELWTVIGEEKDIERVAKKVFLWVNDKVKLLEYSRTYPLNLKGDLDPLTTLRGGWGTETDIAIFTVAALRSIGIAARIVYAPVIANEEGGKVWLEYRDQKQWVPWVPSAPMGVDVKRWLNQEFGGKWAYIVANPQQPVNITPSYTATETLWLCPTPLTVEKFDATAMVLCNGRLQPVSGRDIYNVEPENSFLGLGVGRYVVVAGDYSKLASIKPILLGAGKSGWFQMDFEARKQQYEQAKRKPEFFAWLPEQGGEQVSW